MPDLVCPADVVHIPAHTWSSGCDPPLSKEREVVWQSTKKLTKTNLEGSNQGMQRQMFQSKEENTPQEPRCRICGHRTHTRRGGDGGICEPVGKPRAYVPSGAGGKTMPPSVMFFR